MRTDELQRGLALARAEQQSADVVAGRHGVRRHVRRQRFERAGFVALIIVLLAGTGLFLATRGTDEQRVISGPGVIPHYLPDPLPSESVLLQQYPAPRGPEEATVGTTQVIVWTNDPSSSPTDGSRVLRLVASQHTTRAAGEMKADLQATERGFRVAWVDESGTTFSLDAIGGSQSEVEEAQASATIDANGRAVMEAPAGFREVVRRTYDMRASYPQVPDSSITDPEYPGFVAALEESRYPRTSFSAFATPRAESWALVAAYELEPTSIRGRAGYLVRREAQQTSATPDGGTAEFQTIEIAVALIWWETDSVVLSVTGKTEGEARVLAESLRLADARTWTNFVESSEPFPSNESTRSSVSSSVSGTTVP
jgi:hypothetical protein